MTPTSDDDRFDELLQQAARDYNAPREVPREAMWARIAEARATARRPAQPTSIVNRSSKHRGWFWAGIGIAAALVLSTGIIIGRRFDRGAAVTMAVKSGKAPVVDTKPPASVVATAVPSKTGEDTTVKQLHEETRKTDAQVRELASAAPAPDTPGQANQSLAYQLVVMRHLAGAEAMITSFRSSARRGEHDAAMANWSRELLGTTRMLEASPVTQDPVMKRMLDDLDLVITQIVQYTAKGTYDPDELGLIEHSIDKRGVISKLRSTLPARPMPAGL